MRLELNLDFEERFAPDRFFFGVANAPYSEGGGLNVADGFKNIDLVATGRRDGDAYEGNRFWTSYAEHIELAASLGLNAFRMGLEWARCQPSPTTEPLAEPPAWDPAALDHYADIVELVIDRGMQPIITLHHFTHPLWLGVDIWLEDVGPSMLAEAQVHMIDEINDRLMARGGKRMAHFLVYNEPNIVPFFFHTMARYPVERQGTEFLLPAFDTMLAHYVKAYDGIHDLFEAKGWGTPQVGFTIASLCSYEHDKQLDDLLRVRSWGVAREDAAAMIASCRTAWRVRIDDLARSQLTNEQFDRYLSTVEASSEALPPAGFSKTLDAVYASPRARKLDYLSLNVYEPFGGPKREPGDTDRRIKWERYRLDGEVYRTFILATNDGNTDLPVFMGENSCVHLQRDGEPPQPRPDGWTRERYLKTYLMEMVRCMKEGVPIEGYLYWTLIDDVQPARLGLYHYDFDRHEIRDTDGFENPSGRIYGHLIAALRTGDRARIRDAFVNEYRQGGGEG